MSDLFNGWSAAEVDADELVDDDWIANNTKTMESANPIRHLFERAQLSLKTFGVDPKNNSLRENTKHSLIYPFATEPTAERKATGGRLTLQSGGFTRDQMRRIVARTGIPGVEAWSAHNYGTMRAVWGFLGHHTGTDWAAPGDYPTLRVVRDGRPGLENSLCMFGLGKTTNIYLVSNLLSWHAGVGSYNGLTDGNGYLAGIEAESDGLPGHWTEFQQEAYPRLGASILLEIHDSDRYSTRHAVWAPTRKIDFSNWPGGPETFWNRVYYFLAHPEQININWTSDVQPSIDEDEDMATIVWVNQANGGKVPFLLDGLRYQWISDNGFVTSAIRSGVKQIQANEDMHSRLTDFTRGMTPKAPTAVAPLMALPPESS